MRRTREIAKLCALKTFAASYGWLALVLLALGGCRKADQAERFVPRLPGTVTFNKDIAPIVFQNCSGCHRPGESTPFPLLGYEDTRKHAKQIVDVTRRRVMPPWLPDRNLIHLVGERGLTVQQIGLLQQWAEEGAAEGAQSDLPPVPVWSSRWPLGEPDLVVKPVVGFKLSAEGSDTYRNLIIPIPLGARRFVRGIELRPNSRAVHHAFLRFDKTGQSRLLDGQDGQPGFPGIHAPRTAESPITFASWQPGKTPRFYPADLAWAMETNTDLILQLHLQPIGKEELIAPEVALYFTDQPGTAIALKVPLDSFAIEIPAGATNHLVTDEFVLPVDVELRGVLPHAHYLGHSLKGYALLPDGSRRWLMAIKEWDFNWQGDYQFSTPLALPKGTKLVMEYTYDNSTNNPRNPHQPPRTVIYGSQTTDEMAELWLQIVMKSQDDLQAMNKALQPRFLKDGILANEALLRRNPNDARAHSELGFTLLMSGRPADGLIHLNTAIRLDPAYDEPHYFAGVAYRSLKRTDEARQEFETALQINPKHARAHGNLGLVLAQQGDIARAAEHFRAALLLNPEDEIARSMLQQAEQALRGPGK